MFLVLQAMYDFFKSHNFLKTILIHVIWFQIHFDETNLDDLLNKASKFGRLFASNNGSTFYIQYKLYFKNKLFFNNLEVEDWSKQEHKVQIQNDDSVSINNYLNVDDGKQNSILNSLKSFFS